MIYPESTEHDLRVRVWVLLLLLSALTASDKGLASMFGFHYVGFRLDLGFFTVGAC